MLPLDQDLSQKVEAEAENRLGPPPMFLDEDGPALAPPFSQGMSKAERDGQHGDELGDPVRMDEVGVFKVEAARLGGSKQRLNGLITNDKFCLVRTAQLALTWWRRPLRRRGCKQASQGAGPDLESDRGGAHASTLAGPSTGADCFGRGTAMGSGLQPPPGLGAARSPSFGSPSLVGRSRPHLPSGTGGDP